MIELYDEDNIAKTFMPIVIKRYRAQTGLSQRNLAYQMGISKSYITSLESGARAPNLNLLVRMAETFGVRPGELVDAMVDEAKKDFRLKYWRE